MVLMAQHGEWDNVIEDNPVDQNQQEIVEAFEFLGDWTERYQYIIDCGKTLPDLAETDKIDANKLSGCQSQVWLVTDRQDQYLHFRATSDALIVSGLIALLLKIYSGQLASNIKTSKPWFVDQLELTTHLSATRSNGLASMLKAIYAATEQ